MRLIGFAFDDAAGPVERGYVPLGGLTVALGANDVGKTRMMHSLASSLDGHCCGGPAGQYGSPRSTTARQRICCSLSKTGHARSGRASASAAATKSAAT
jgi:hypothetical protein